MQAGHYARGEPASDFLWNEERAQVVWRLSHERREQCGLAAAVDSRDADVLGVTHRKVRYAQTMLPLRQLTCLHAHEHLARASLRVHPYIARVLLVHVCLLKRLPHLLQTCVHARGELAGNAVLAGVDRQLDAPLAIMILRIEVACASLRVRLACLVAPPRGFGLDACRLALGVPSLALRGLRIACGCSPACV